MSYIEWLDGRGQTGLCGEWKQDSGLGIQNEGDSKDAVLTDEVEWLLAIKSGGPLLLSLGGGCLFPLPVS